MAEQQPLLPGNPQEEFRRQLEQMQRMQEWFQRMQGVQPLKDFYDPSNYGERPGVQIPAGDVEIKPQVLSLIKHYHGLGSEDPFQHLEDLTTLVQTTKSRNVNEEQMIMRLFPHSLRDKAAHWYRTIGRPITTWNELKSAFLKKFFPVGRTNALRRAITTFTQRPGEQFHVAWERFQDLLRRCPHHEVPKWQLVQIFYHGLNEQLRNHVDASCGGNFLNKDADSAHDLFEEMSENSINHASMDTFNRSQQPRSNVNEVHDSHSFDMELICNKLDKVDLVAKRMEEWMAGNSMNNSQSTQSQNSGFHSSRALSGREFVNQLDATQPMSQHFSEPHGFPTGAFNPSFSDPSLSFSSSSPYEDVCAV
jgi:hypothetical protein